MSDQNGIKQTPFSDAWPTPGTEGTGVNGTGDGFDQGSGGNGIVSSPFTEAVVPTPGGQRTADGLGTPPDTVQLTDAPGKGSNAPWDVTSSRNTVDKR